MFELNIWHVMSENKNYAIMCDGVLTYFKNIKKQNLLKQCVGQYPNVCLSVKHKSHLYKIHILVAKYFIDNPLNRKEVNHIDGDKSNYKLNNLEWCSRSENMIHGFKTGLIKSGENHHISELTNSEVLEIRRAYSEKEASMRMLAKKYNVSYGCINSIIHIKTYKYI